MQSNIGKIIFIIAAAHCVTTPALATNTTSGPVEARAAKEDKLPPNYFAVGLYKPNYILPYYYTGSPYNAAYQNNTPTNEQLRHNEVKYQFSLKVPAWKNIFGHPSSLFLAYTQLSYWQLYNRRSFVSETDYQPEIFLANEVNWHLTNIWNLNFLNLGASHQSNGFGNTMERSWNRLYGEATTSTEHWMINLRPWIVLSTNKNNNNIASYLGYEEVTVSYKFFKQVLSLQAYNLEHGKRASTELTWSFPLIPYIKGYVQAFSGYGQSLIEYNHRTNSAGIGIALNDWV